MLFPTIAPHCHRQRLACGHPRVRRGVTHPRPRSTYLWDLRAGPHPTEHRRTGRPGLRHPPSGRPVSAQPCRHRLPPAIPGPRRSSATSVRTVVLVEISVAAIGYRHGATGAYIYGFPPQPPMILHQIAVCADAEVRRDHDLSRDFMRALLDNRDIPADELIPATLLRASTLREPDHLRYLIQAGPVPDARARPRSRAGRAHPCAAWTTSSSPARIGGA